MRRDLRVVHGGGCVKAIRTRYSGILFRSRLEARWAVFFDALGIAWEFEAEGYELEDGTQYLPDFWLPKFSGGVYVEIKPPGDPFYKSRKFALESPRPIWLCDGDPIWRTWTVLERELRADDIGWWEPRVIEWQAVPLMCRAREEHRFWFNPGTLETREEAEPYEEHLFAAFDEARGHSFWEPEVRP